MTWLTQEAWVLQPLPSGQVQVQACTTNSCSTCSLASSCGNGLLAKWLSPKQPKLVLTTHLILQTGDRVLLGIPAQQLNLAALLQFGLPLLTLFLAIGLGEFFNLAQGLNLAWVALLGLAVGLILARKLARPSPIQLLRKLNS